MAPLLFQSSRACRAGSTGGRVGEVGGGDVMAAGLAEEALRVRPGLVWRKRGGEFLRALYLRARWVGGQLGGRGRGELGSRWNNSL